MTASRPRSLMRSIAVAALLAAALPAGAGAHTTANSPAIAVGAGGTAHAAWLQEENDNGMVLERRRAPSGTLTDAQYVSPAGRYANQPRIAADPSGNAIIAWNASDGSFPAVYSRRRAPDGTLGPIERISPVGKAASSVELAVDPNGNAVYTWLGGERQYATVQARRRTAGGALSATQTLTAPGWTYSPRVGLDSAGNALISWVRYAPETASGPLQVRRRAVDGALGPTQTLATAANPPYDLAIAGDGRAVVAWEWSRETDTVIRGRTRAADGTLSTAQTLSPADWRSFNPRVALDSTGRAVFTWVQFDALPETYDVQGRVRSAAGALGTRFFLGSGYSTVDPRVEVDANGNALFAWSTDAFAAGGAHRIQARRRTPAGSMSATQDISTPGANAHEPVLGLDANGAAVIAWAEGQNGVWTVQSRRRTALGELSPIAKLSE